MSSLQENIDKKKEFEAIKVIQSAGMYIEDHYRNLSWNYGSFNSQLRMELNMRCWKNLTKLYKVMSNE